MPRRLAACLALLLLCFAAAAAPAAAAPAAAAPAAAAPAAAAGEELPPGIQRDSLLIEISTADFYELAARARELGLPDTGGVEELRSKLYKYFALEAPALAAKGRVITIERAGKASYSKVEDEEGGLVRATGGVILSLVEANGDTHRIQANSLAYDRAHGTMSARGSVSYERKSGSTTEIFTGEAISANLSDWSGVFVDGKVRRAGLGTGSGQRGLVVEADTILRRSADVMVLKDGVISSCDADDPHYAVRAGRVWLLGDKEWAVSNALFSLGNVPILWLPFFYYPGDELAFHPVIGYRSREGRFVQTTYYLLGSKPPAKATDSILSFQDSGSAKPTKLKGLFLTRVPGPAPKDEGSLKTLADLYSGLGGFAGIQGSLPKLGILDKTDFFAGLGLSRTLFPPGTDSYQVEYSPYVSAGGYKSIWNGSNLFNISLPFRYGFDITTAIHQGSLTASLALPLYSDSTFDQDFRNRSEDMDWLKVFSSTDTSLNTIASRTQLLPRLDASYSLKIKALDPWLSSIDITRFSSSMTLLTKQATLTESAPLSTYDPMQNFFYPATFRPFDISASLRGSLLGSPAQVQPGQAPKTGAAAGPSIELRSPWEDSSEAPASTALTGLAAPESASAKPPAEDFRLPARAPDAPSAKSSSWTGSVGWTFTPSMYFEDGYDSSLWRDPSYIDFGSLSYSLLSYRMLATLDSSAAYGDLLSSSLSLSYSDQDQSRPVGRATYLQADNLYKSRRLGESVRMSFRPFASDWLWSGSSLSWGLDSTIYGLQYDSRTLAFKDNWLSWDPASITSHNLSLNLAARPGSLTQSLTLTANLPPLLDSYSGSLALNAGIASLRVQSRMYRKVQGGDFSFDPVTTNLSLGLAPGPLLSDSLVYDTGGLGPTSNSTSLAWGPLNASLSERRTLSYKPVIGSGWIPIGTDQSFIPSDFALSFNPQLKSMPLGSAALASTSGAGAGSAQTSAASPLWSLGANIALAQSLLRFTESTLSFQLTASVNMADKFSLSVSSQSQNSAAWRYYAWAFASPLESAGISKESVQVNPLTDIWEALSIWDEASLHKSLFKLKGLSFRAAQDLHDWTLSAEVSTAPLYKDLKYSLNTTFTILLAWKDIQTLKSTVKKDSTGLSY